MVSLELWSLELYRKISFVSFLNLINLYSSSVEYHLRLEMLKLLAQTSKVTDLKGPSSAKTSQRDISKRRRLKNFPVAKAVAPAAFQRSKSEEQ